MSIGSQIPEAYASSKVLYHVYESVVKSFSVDKCKQNVGDVSILKLLSIFQGLMNVIWIIMLKQVLLLLMLNGGHAFIIAVLWPVNIVSLCDQSHIRWGKLTHWICHLSLPQNIVVVTFYALTLYIFFFQPFLINCSIAKSVKTANHVIKSTAH